MRLSRFVSVATLAVITTTAVLSACSSNDEPAVTERAAAADPVGPLVAGNPAQLPALPPGTGTGELAPNYAAAILTPSSWVAASLTPTLSVPGGAAGRWTFTVKDFSDGTGAFAPYVEQASGPSTRLPTSAGLTQGRAYQWTASSEGQVTVGGSFVVDVQLEGVQETDGVGGVTAHLSSGEASFAWSSHGLNTIAGQVGFGLRFQGSNPPEVGVPAGWVLDAATSSPYRRIEERDDGTVGVVASNGMVANYRLLAGSYVPVRLSDGSKAAEGQSPVLSRNPDGTWAVTTKHTTTLFRDDTNNGIAQPVDIISGDRPVLSEIWQRGLVRAVVDPASGRQLDFVYGGGACPTPPAGFVPAPADLLCEVRFWDGSTSQVHYVNTPNGSVSIGRIVDFPEAGPDAAVVDLAYDAAGRITRTRQPLVAQAAASGVIDAQDPQFWAEIGYDGEGRVISLTEAAPAPGATRCTRTIDYLQLVSTSVTDSCVGRVVKQIDFDQGTFFPQRSTNAHGQTAIFEWDYQTGQLLQVESFEGLITRNTYENGLLVESQGPTRGPLSQAQITSRQYDQDFTMRDEGSPMVGLDVAYWPSATNVTDGGVKELGPQVDGFVVPSLLMNWYQSPAGNDGPWSAVMTGAMEIRTEGSYTFAVNGSAARLRVNQIPCTDGGCMAMPLTAGLVPIQIEISSETPEASVEIAYQGPDTREEMISVPTDVLRPQYGYATTSEVFDPKVVNAPLTTFSRTVYDNPADGRMSRRSNQSGTTTQLRYEQGDGGRGGWGRQSEAVQPNGASYRMQYWGDRETATAPCPGAKATNQAGAIKTITAPTPGSGAAPSTTQWYDAAGRAIAMQENGGATTCLTLDALGRVSTLELLNMGEAQRTVYNYRAGNNPLITEVTSTRGAKVTTQRVEVDVAGRVVRTVDRFGVTVETTFDARTDQPATVTTTAPGAAPSTTTYTYDNQGWLSSASVDGRVVEQATYNPRDGKLATVTYGNGVTASHQYDDQLRLVSIAYTTPDGRTFRNTRDISASGHISAEMYQAGDTTSRFSYVHDLDGRLVNASVTAGIAPTATAWAYTYDNNSNRATQRVTEGGAVVGNYTYGYDTADRLITTTDPAASGGLEYDARGNATRVGANRFTYNAADRLMVASDGTTTVAFDRDVDGSLIGRSITTPEGQESLQLGDGGVMLDGGGQAMNQRHGLAADVVWIRPLAAGSVGRWEFVGIDGNLFFATDEAGTVVGSPQLYEPFGRAITPPNPREADNPNFTWQGATGNETFTLATEIVMMGARVYLPALGRFVQLDPKVGGSINGYDYAGQNPVNLADPSGEDFMRDWMPIIVATVATIAVSAVLPPAGGFMMGMVMGAVMGAVSYTIMFSLQYTQDSKTQWSWAQFGQQVGAAAVLGGISSKLAAVKKANALKKASAQAKTVADVSEDGVRRTIRNSFDDPRNSEALSEIFSRRSVSIASVDSGILQVVDANFDNVPMLRQSFNRLSISDLGFHKSDLISRMSFSSTSSM